MVSIAAAACVLLHLEELEIRSTRWPLFMLLSSAGRATTPPHGVLGPGARLFSPSGPESQELTRLSGNFLSDMAIDAEMAPMASRTPPAAAPAATPGPPTVRPALVS